MKAKNISYSESVESVNEFGLKRWRKSSIEVDPENDTPEDADTFAKSFVKSSLSTPVTIEQIPEVQRREVVKSPNTIEAFIADINACNSVDEKNILGVQVGLISFKELSSMNPKLQEAYDNRLKELTP